MSRRIRVRGRAGEQVIVPLADAANQELVLPLSLDLRIRARPTVFSSVAGPIGAVANITLAPLTMTAEADVIVTGTGDITLGALTMEATATLSVAAENLSYSAAVTSTDEVDEETGFMERTVTSPAHLAAYAPEGVAGFYVVRPALALNGPLVLYPGAIAVSAETVGGTISLTHAPWAAGIGTVTVDGYRVMLGDTELSDTLPYDTDTEDPGDLIRIFADISDDNGTISVLMYEFTVAEASAGPVLSGFSFDYGLNKVRYASDVAANLTWRRYLPGHVFVNQAAEVLAGTGALDGGTFAIESGANSDAVTFTGGISGPQDLYLVARVGSGPLSNVVGGRVTITVAGALTAPDIRGTSIGGAATAVSSVAVPLPAYNFEDVVILQIGVNCAATDVAGITAVGPNGEVATVKQALVDNEAGSSSVAVGLLYYRATAPNTTGNVTISITPGGTKSIEQIICVPVARFNVKASGDPFAQVVKTHSATAATSVSTAALTAISGSSRIEAFFVNDATLPPGTAPTGWFMRQNGLIGPQAIQSMSRNDQTTGASQSIGAVSAPLAAAQRWVGLTYELLPLGV